MSETVNQEQGMESLNVEQAASKIMGLMEPQEEPQGDPQEEPATQEVTEAEGQLEETQEAPEEVEETEIQEEEAPEVSTYRIKAEGEEHEVTLDDLKQSFQLQANVRKKMESLAHEKKEIEGIKANLQQQEQDNQNNAKVRAQYTDELTKVQEFLNSQKVDFSNLKESDPVQYAIKLAEQQERDKQIQMLQQKKQSLALEQQAENQKLMEKRMQIEKQRLFERVPDLQDEKKANEITNKLRAYALTKGYSEQEINSVMDSRFIGVVYDAVFPKQSEERQKVVMKKVKNAPKMVKSGVATPASTESERLRKLKSTAKKTGKVKDAAKFFEAML